jgi:hypothetical protein
MDLNWVCDFDIRETEILSGWCGGGGLGEDYEMEVEE